MRLPTTLLLSLVLASALSGCTRYRSDSSWPKPRPLGEEMKIFRLPLKPEEVARDRTIKEPSGAITLAQALALALTKSPNLASFGWEVRAREAATLQSGLLPNPEIDVQVENFAGGGELRGLEGSETTIQLSQVIQLAGKRSKRTRVAALERDLASWDYEAKRLDVVTEGTKAFVGLLAAQEQLALTEELVRLAQEVFDTVSARVQAGKVSPIEETKAGVALAKSRIERGRADRRLASSRKRLAATWGSTSPTFEKVVGKLDEVKPIPSIEQLAKRVSGNPDIARWSEEIEQRRAVLELEQALRIPDLTLGGGIRRLNATNDDTYVFGLSIPLPFFNRNQGGILEARYELARGESEQSLAFTRVNEELAEAYRELSSAFMEATSLKEKVLPGAKKSFEATAEGYRQGKFGFLDVLDAQRTFFEARREYIGALAAYHIAAAEVERSVGISLENTREIPEKDTQERR